MICARRDAELTVGYSNALSLNLEAEVRLPRSPSGIVLLVKGRGNGRPSTFQRLLSEGLRARGLGTCLVDLLAPSEDRLAEKSKDPDLLAERLERVVNQLAIESDTWQLPMALVGIDAATPAALMLAAERPETLASIACCYGRPDVARTDLARVRVPTLLVAPGNNAGVLASHESAFLQLKCESQLAVVRESRHRLAEAEIVADCERIVRSWCVNHLRRAACHLQRTISGV